MKLSIGQRILCCLAGSAELTEQTVAGFLHPLDLNGATVLPIRLESGRTILPGWVFAAVTPTFSGSAS